MKPILLLALSALALAAQNYSINAPAIFGGTSAVNKAQIPNYATPEYFGAYGDNSHDDTAAINAAIASVLSSGNCQLMLTCTVELQAKTYKTTGPITLAGSYVTLRGQGMSSTFISNTATTGDGIDVTGTGANCNTGAAFWDRVESLQVTRPNGTTAGVGLNLTDTCWAKIVDVQLSNNYIGVLLSGSGDTLVQDTQASGASNSAYGYEISGTNNSTTFRRTVYDGSLSSGFIGLYTTGCPSDTFLDWFQGAHGAYGIQINGTTESGVNICNGDIHINTPIIDTAGTAGIQVNNVNSGGLAAVDINGGYVSGVGIGVDFENVSGGSIRGIQLRPYGSGSIGVKIAGASSNADIVQGNVIQLSATCVSVNGSGTHSITNNTCTGVSTQAVTTGFNFVSSSNNSVRNNAMGGTFTTSFAFDSGSSNNAVDGNQGFAYSTVTNSGAGNNFGTLLVAPTTNCGTATGNSASGTIAASSSVSSCTLTFPISVTGYTCHLDNWSVPSNVISQTNASATTAVMTGTIVSGNTLSYECSYH